MDIIVQKFGGTSVSCYKNRKKVIGKIIEKINENYDVVVVVSAIGRKESPYSTDSLIDLIDKKSINNREYDLLLSCGEIISAVVLSDLLNKKGYKTKVFTGYQAGIKTNDNFNNAEIVDINPTNIIKSLEKKIIPIVAGFQGATLNGEITTLGRGGSDITAVALGKALNSKYVEIYTDVDGIMTADPNIVPDAKVLETMDYLEVYQLAEDGAKVIHSKAVEIAQQSDIPLKIKNTFSNHKGTTIKNFHTKFNDKKQLYKDNIITAITCKKDRVQVLLYIDDEDKLGEFMEKITINNISIDLINFFINKKVFTISREDLNVLEKILNENNYKYKVIEKCCKLSTIGYKMRGVPGVMARIVKALSSEKIKILQSSDSHNTIWCLINESDTDKAIRALHKEFKLYK